MEGRTLCQLLWSLTLADDQAPPCCSFVKGPADWSCILSSRLLHNCRAAVFFLHESQGGSYNLRGVGAPCSPSWLTHSPSTPKRGSAWKRNTALGVCALVSWRTQDEIAGVSERAWLHRRKAKRVVSPSAHPRSGDTSERAKSERIFHVEKSDGSCHSRVDSGKVTVTVSEARTRRVFLGFVQNRQEMCRLQVYTMDRSKETLSSNVVCKKQVVLFPLLRSTTTPSWIPFAVLIPKYREKKRRNSSKS
jgi:hypothetical protein